MNRYAIFAGLALGAGAVFGAGEVPIESLAPDSGVVAEEKDVTILLSDWLSARGWTEGINSGKNGIFIVTTAAGAIQASATSPSYNDARVRAFDKAMLSAKAKLASLLESEISTAVESSYVEPASSNADDPRQQLAKAIASAPSESLLGKCNRLLHAKLDNALKKEGVDDSAIHADIEALRAKVASITSAESFRKSVRAESKVALSGAQAFYTVEAVKGKQAEIGVVLIWSPKLAEMASSLVTGLPVRGTSSKAPIRDQLSTDESILLSTFGVQQKINEKGEYVLVAFGQSGARSESSRAAQAAYDKAALQARALIRQFAGETVAVSEAQEQAEQTLEFSDSALPNYSDVSSYEQYQKSVAAKMTINGIATVRKWNARHPISGRMVYGTIMSWSPSNAALARGVKKAIESTATSGAAGVRSVPTAIPASSAPVVAKPTASERLQSGSAGDDDAF